MRQITATEKFRAVNEGLMAEAEFVRQMRQLYPMYVSQYSGYKDTVQILKNKGLIFEVKEEEHKLDSVSDEAIRRGIDAELEALGVDSAGFVSNEHRKKARAKAIKNLKKDPLHYLNLISGESSKVDKHDQSKETKRGAKDVDTFNGLKKASLKENKSFLTEGTRALIGYLDGDRLTTTYNHYDGYPSNLGKGLETHYNDDDKAKDVALKGYITYLDPETGEIEQTHKDPPKKIALSQDEEEFAREIAEEIDGMSADFGYIWDDRSNRWVTIKNTGIRSMIDQIMEKLGDYGGMEEEVVEVDSTLDPYEDKKAIIQQVIDLLKTEKGADNEVIKDFIKTHYEDIINLRDDQAILDEFEEFVSVNYEGPSDMDEKKLNEEGVEDANYKMGEAFKRYGIDLSRDVIVVEMDGGTAGLGGGQLDIEPAEPAMLVAKRLERHRLDTILDYESEGSNGDFPVQYEDGFYGDYTPEGTEHKLTYSEDGGTMWDIFQAPSGVSEKKGKDHDGDGDIDGDDYMAAKDKAIKKATGKKAVNEYRGSGDEIIEVIKQMAMEMDGDEIEAAMEVMEFIGEHYKIDFEFGRAGGGNYGRNDGAPYEGKASKKPMGKDEIVKENIKAIITRVLEEQVIAEAATANLSNWGEGYAGFDGVKTVVNDLENIVTEIESFYDKVADKIANAFEKTKEFRNLDGMQVGAFIAPSLEAAFKKDLRPVTKTGFFNKIELPKVRTISQADIDANNSGERPLGEEEKQTVFSAPTVNGTLRESKK